MNLIEKLGIEKCRKIVEGAPKHAEYYSPLSYLNKYKKSVRDNTHKSDVANGYTKSYDFWDGRKWNGCACMPEHLEDLIPVFSIRTAIANHDQHWYGRPEAEEIEAYKELSKEKIEGGAVLVGDFSKAKKIFNTVIESDHCTDIRNHISPLMKVIEG